MELTSQQIKAKLQEVILLTDCITDMLNHAIADGKATPLLFTMISQLIAQMKVTTDELKKITTTVDLG